MDVAASINYAYIKYIEVRKCKVKIKWGLIFIYKCTN